MPELDLLQYVMAILIVEGRWASLEESWRNIN